MTAAILDGIVLGLQFGILGVGLTIMYGLGGVLNLAYGSMAVVAAVVVSFSMRSGLPAGLAVLLGILTAAGIGLALNLTILKPVYRRQGEARVLLSLILTIGVAFIIDGFLVWRFPIEVLSLSIGGNPVLILGVPMRTGSLLASAITLLTGGALIFFFRATVTGRAVRSVIQDEVGAQLCGVNPATTRTLIFTLSGALVGLVVVMQSMTSPVPISAGFEITILALMVTVVGGLGSIRGAMLAGLILGVVHAMSSFYIGSYITTIILLAAAAFTILLRPSGLFGKHA
ncbi:MAG: branched-chain amino acid ABC transporter permease [Actinomycetota bacterium]|nr:branched-chain amino acid ABC transporter permease [Actinomycetota bacterium]MDK1027477.1 branched-chain amino acid ABC transporter permease [Actinomycetota bacterium]MDK1095825.1 branched-chain amino acid ABC transporter permease [Actinomycetota bacterium]